VSRWPIERTLSRGWKRLRGRSPLHTLYLHPDGVWSWCSGAEPATCEGFDAWCEAHAGNDARLLLSGHMVHNIVVDASLGLRQDGPLRSYALQQFVHYHGAAAQSWPLATWSEGGQSVASALHAVDWIALRRAAAAHDVVLVGATPVWSAGLGSLSMWVPEFQSGGRRALALVEGTLVSWLVVESGRLTALLQRRLDAPQVGALADMLVQLVAASQPLTDAPLVVGWGVADAENAADLPARVLVLLGTDAVSGAWVRDHMGPGA